jgi:anti-anti-sigma regulatory factor
LERREEMLRALADGRSVVFDLSAVSRIDTAGLQLLLTFVLNMRSEGRAVTYCGASAPVLQGARLAGLSVKLELPNEVTPASA